MKCDSDCYEAVSAKIKQAQAVIVCMIGNDHFKYMGDAARSNTLKAVATLLGTAEEQLKESWQQEDKA